MINASLAGVIAAAREAGVARIRGMRFGIEGLLAGDLLDLGQQPAAFLDRLRTTPSAALGSCRYRLRPDDLAAAIEALDRENARYFIYIGGNDSADNDLPLTDHCPGYGSAARFIAQATAEAGLDTRAMRRTDPIKLIEVMGRHAGWLAAAAWLGKRDERSGPHLVYLPERPVPTEAMLADVEAVYGRLGYCVVALSENQPGPGGAVLGASGEPRWIDDFGHAYYDSPAQYLALELRRQVGVRTRVDKPGTLQRSSAAHLSTTDLAEAEMAGRAAVRLALAGRSDLMVTLVREPGDPYRCSTGTAPLAEVANRQRTIPAEFIGSDGHSLTAAFEAYARPLIGDPLPEYAALE